MDYDKVAEKARQIVELTYPSESEQHKAAFANSVAYLVTGWARDDENQSVRELAITLVGYGFHLGTRHPFAEAIEILIGPSGPIFGPLLELHEEVWRDFRCFGDDPRDVEELVRRTGVGPKR